MLFLRWSDIQQHVSDQWESSLYLSMLLAHILLRYNDFEFTKFTQMPLNYHNDSPHSPMLQIIANLLTRAYIVEAFDRSPYSGTIPPRICHHKITPWIPWVPMLGRSQNHMPLPSIHWTLRRWKRIQNANVMGALWVHHGSKPTTFESWWLVFFLGGGIGWSRFLMGYTVVWMWCPAFYWNLWK